MVFILAEMVGFEPTWRVTANSISSRARYDHFDTSPYRACLTGAYLFYHAMTENTSAFSEIVIIFISPGRHPADNGLPHSGKRSRTGDLAAAVDHNGGRAAVQHGRLIRAVLLHDLAAALDRNAERMHLTAVNDHHDNRAVLRLTDGRARLLLVQAGACDQILAVDDERRVKLHRVAQTGGIVERTDLQMILVVKADDLPAIAYCVLILLSLAFQEAVHGAARAVAVKIGKAGGVDARTAS